MMRANMTRNVSKIGIPKTAKQNAISPMFCCANMVLAFCCDKIMNTQQVSAAPIINVPLSPIYIFDF